MATENSFSSHSLAIFSNYLQSDLGRLRRPGNLFRKILTVLAEATHKSRRLRIKREKLLKTREMRACDRGGRAITWERERRAGHHIKEGLT
jgi:hypothetical protein